MRARGILLTTITVLFVAAAPAGAAKLRSVSRTVTATGGATGHGPVVTAVARCPTGTKALSGGYTTSVPQVPAHWLAVSESKMTSRLDGWRVSGSEHFAAPAGDTLTAHVYCEKRKRPVQLGSTIRTDLIPSVPGQSTGGTAKCPDGTRAISGGFSTLSSSAYFYLSNGKDRNWNVAVTNIDGATQDLYGVEAYCVRAKVLTVFAPQMVGGPSGNAVTALATRCSKGTLLRGGGFRAEQPVGGLAKAALVFDDSLSGRAWSVSASTTGGAPVNFSARGLCRAS